MEALYVTALDADLPRDSAHSEGRLFSVRLATCRAPAGRSHQHRAGLVI